MNSDTNNEVITPRTDEAAEAMGLKAFVVPIEICRQLERELSEKTNDAARLREVCKWAADMMDGISPARGQEIRDAIARLAPAPEEPTIKESLQVDPKWRELGLDEVIQDGDETMDLQGNWQKAEISIGRTPRNRCTKVRRPLPKPKLTRESYDEDWNLKPKQEEMPLEDEIERIETRDAWIDPTKDIIACIRYLRDEMVKIGNISSEDSGYNFTEIQKIWKEIQKLKQK
jgi:hypothetical protein